jgi:hypothetical protein
MRTCRGRKQVEPSLRDDAWRGRPACVSGKGLGGGELHQRAFDGRKGAAREREGREARRATGSCVEGRRGRNCNGHQG